MGCEIWADAAVAPLLQRLRAGQVQLDCIVSDWRLEEGDGVAAIAALRDWAGQPLPALLISGETVPLRRAGQAADHQRAQAAASTGDARLARCTDAGASRSAGVSASSLARGSKEAAQCAQVHLARHVEGASHRAEGYTRAKAGNIGACIGTSGPAGTDMITGLYSAIADSIPML